MSENVTAFKPRRAEAPKLQSMELRLAEDFTLEMSLFDERDGVAIVEFSFKSKSPETFDMDALREAWNGWREKSEIAS
jgi:hypothetical protein